MNRWLGIGKRVAVIRYDIKTNRDRIDEGRIVAIKRWESMTAEYRRYAVQFNDGRIELFDAEELCTKWMKGLK